MSRIRSEFQLSLVRRQARPGSFAEMFAGREEKTMSGPDGVAGDRLRSFVERIERIDEDLKAMNDEKKDVFAEAKGEGFDVKILKAVIRLRKQDQNERDERDTLLDLYLHAIETAPSLKSQAAE